MLIKYFVLKFVTNFFGFDRTVDIDSQDFVLVLVSAMFAARLLKYPAPPVGNIQLWMAVDRTIAVLIVLAVWSLQA